MMYEKMISRQCRSKSEFGSCGRGAKHTGNHAVYLGPPHFWFLYTRNRPAKAVGYATWDDETGWTLK